MNVDPPLLCDHSLVVVSIDLHIPPVYAISRHARRSSLSLDVDVFVKDLRQSTLVLAPPSDDDDLFQCYNVTPVADGRSRAIANGQPLFSLSLIHI